MRNSFERFIILPNSDERRRNAVIKFIKKLTASKLESENRFPNLLADRDFVSYYWTLPFTTL